MNESPDLSFKGFLTALLAFLGFLGVLALGDPLTALLTAVWDFLAHLLTALL